MNEIGGKKVRALTNVRTKWVLAGVVHWPCMGDVQFISKS